METINYIKKYNRKKQAHIYPHTYTRVRARVCILIVIFYGFYCFHCFPTHKILKISNLRGNNALFLLFPIVPDCFPIVSTKAGTEDFEHRAKIRNLQKI